MGYASRSAEVHELPVSHWTLPDTHEFRMILRILLLVRVGPYGRDSTVLRTPCGLKPKENTMIAVTNNTARADLLT